MENKVYLGDSVYAFFDGFGILLTTENGYPDRVNNQIYLEPAVFQALTVVAEKWRELCEENTFPTVPKPPVKHGS